jgi:hypothetical protein
MYTPEDLMYNEVPQRYFWSDLMSNPIVLAGQVYLHVELNDYIVVKRNHAGYVSYEGPAVVGKCDVCTLMDQTIFLPVDPANLSGTEIQTLQEFLPSRSALTTGVVLDIEDDGDE